jgi:hypothetical protein
LLISFLLDRCLGDLTTFHESSSQDSKFEYGHNLFRTNEKHWLCSLCLAEVEDEFHFTVKCTSLYAVRDKLYDVISAIIPSFVNMPDQWKTFPLLYPSNHRPFLYRCSFIKRKWSIFSIFLKHFYTPLAFFSSTAKPGRTFRIIRTRVSIEMFHPEQE